MAKTLQGKYRPLHPEKYKGNVSNILYRSSWEREFMKWCDSRVQVLEWQSEEKAIWYYDPVAKKKRRYFPDFIVKYERNDGIICEEVIEVKPKRQIEGPPRNPKRRTKAWMRSVQTYMTNLAKWKAAAEWAENRGLSFRLISEKELGIYTGH